MGNEHVDPHFRRLLELSGFDFGPSHCGYGKTQRSPIIEAIHETNQAASQTDKDSAFQDEMRRG